MIRFLIPAMFILFMAGCTAPSPELTNAAANLSLADLDSACETFTKQKRGMQQDVRNNDDAYASTTMATAIGVFTQADNLCAPPYDDLAGRADKVRSLTLCITRLRGGGECSPLY